MNAPRPWITSQNWALAPAQLDELRHHFLMQPQAFTFDEEEEDETRPEDDELINNGVAVLPIHGTILKRATWWYWRTSSADSIREQFNRLVNRSDVRAIVLDVDSGGGTVDGTCSLAKAIYDARDVKPIIGVANEFAASAAYWILSAASEVVLCPTAEVGSIGVYTIHMDFSKWDEEHGIKETVIRAGKYKAAFARPLTKDTQEHIQELIDRIYTLFVDDVAKHRDVTPDAALEQMADARDFIGQQAVDAGLADRIGTLDEVIADLQESTQPVNAGGHHAQNRRTRRLQLS